jgi:hypothetical protein
MTTFQYHISVRILICFFCLPSSQPTPLTTSSQLNKLMLLLNNPPLNAAIHPPNPFIIFSYTHTHSTANNNPNAHKRTTSRDPVFLFLLTCKNIDVRAREASCPTPALRRFTQYCTHHACTCNVHASTHASLHACSSALWSVMVGNTPSQEMMQRGPVHSVQRRKGPGRNSPLSAIVMMLCTLEIEGLCPSDVATEAEMGDDPPFPRFVSR